MALIQNGTSTELFCGHLLLTRLIYMRSWHYEGSKYLNGSDHVPSILSMCHYSTLPLTPFVVFEEVKFGNL